MRRPRKTSPRVADKEKTMPQTGFGTAPVDQRGEISPPVHVNPHDERERLEAQLLAEGYSRMSAKSDRIRAGFDPLTFHLLSSSR
jgi:hypothetical protein